MNKEYEQTKNIESLVTDCRLIKQPVQKEFTCQESITLTRPSFGRFFVTVTDKRNSLSPA